MYTYGKADVKIKGWGALEGLNKKIGGTYEKADYPGGYVSCCFLCP